MADKEVTNVLDEKTQNLLDRAIKARQKMVDAKKKVEDKKKAEEKAKELVIKAKLAVKKAKDDAKKLDKEKVAIEKLAGYKVESETTRKVIAGYYFYQIIDKFDTGKDGKVIKNGEFNKKYKSLMSADVSKAVLDCATYYPDTDTIRINGKELRAKIDELVNKKENAINDAYKLIDAEIKKSLLPDPKTEEKAK